MPSTRGGQEVWVPLAGDGEVFEVWCIVKDIVEEVDPSRTAHVPCRSGLGCIPIGALDTRSGGGAWPLAWSLTCSSRFFSPLRLKDMKKCRGQILVRVSLIYQTGMTPTEASTRRKS